MIKEQDLVNDVLSALHSQAVELGLPFQALQIESGATAIGIPDIFLLVGDKACWIECKRYIPNEPDGIKAKGVRTVEFEGIANYRPGQYVMLERFARHGENAFTLCISQYKDVYFYRHHGLMDSKDYSTLHLRKAKGVTLPYALQELCDHLNIDYSA